jgi:hypothetical protein
MAHGVMLLPLLPLLTPPAPAGAQDHQHTQPAWVEDVGVAAANAVFGAATAGVTAWLRGDDVGRAVVRGAAGGGIVYAGKRLVVEEFDGAGLLGRQVASLGSSVVTNAGAGRDWLEEVWLPVGPLWVQASPASPRRLRVNAWALASVGWALSRSELELDWRQTLSDGAFVFRSPHHRIRNEDGFVDGVTIGGLLLLAPTDFDHLIRAHEAVHVVQQDFWVLAWSRPIESWGWSRLLGRDIPLDFGLIPLLLWPKFLADLAEAEAQVLEFR